MFLEGEEENTHSQSKEKEENGDREGMRDERKRGDGAKEGEMRITTSGTMIRNDRKHERIEKE